MKLTATDFEMRHRLALTLFVYAMAFACWPLDRHDVLGFIAERSSDAPFVSRALFGLAAIPTIVAAVLQSWMVVHTPPGMLRRRRALLGASEAIPILVSVSFGLLLNRLGCLLLVAGITLLQIRTRERDMLLQHPPPAIDGRRPRALATVTLWLLALALVALALTLREWPFYLLIASAIAVRMLQGRTGSGAQSSGQRLAGD